MSESVVVALITTAGGVLVAVLGLMSAAIGVLLKRTGQIRNTAGAIQEETGVIRHEVKNDHGTNLRHDVDALLAEVRAGFAAIHHRLDRHRDRLTDLEETTQGRKPHEHPDHPEHPRTRRELRQRRAVVPARSDR